MDPIMLIIIIGGAFFAYKSGLLDKITGSLGGGGVSAGGGGETAYAGPGGPDIDVAGNGCACANGKCKGNCSEMDMQAGLGNLSPKEYVRGKVPGAFYTRASPFRTQWKWY